MSPDGGLVVAKTSGPVNQSSPLTPNDKHEEAEDDLDEMDPANVQEARHEPAFSPERLKHVNNSLVTRDSRLLVTASHGVSSR